MTAHRLTLATLASFAAVVSFAALSAACSKSDQGTAIQLPGFKDVTDAPAAIQTAARAVVRIGTAGEYATASFISAGGLLLTNNHVLGVGICPREGCYAKITRMHQRHTAPIQPETIFVVPSAIDIGLDMVVAQAYALDAAGAKGAPYSSPDFLTIDSRDPASLEGTHVNIVGHPEGRLKKWSDGTVVDSSGAWVVATAFILPGNSGSPILDDNGHVVGLIHRGPTSQDLVTTNGVDEYSVGTASSFLIPAMSAPLPAALHSTADAVTDAEAVDRELIYLNSHTPTAMVGGAAKSLLDSLGAACDTGLARTDYASPEDLTEALTPCEEATSWIECRTDEAPAVGDFAVCPTADAIPTWRARLQAIQAHTHALNGQDSLDAVTFSQAALSPTKAEGQTAARSSLDAVLGSSQPPLDFSVAVYLAAFGVDDYAGKHIADYVKGYSSVTHYELQANDIVLAMLWLGQSAKIGVEDAKTLLNNLANDKAVDLGAKLFVEEIQYNSNLLN